MFRSNPCILILALINVSNKMLFLTWGPRGSKVRDTGVGDPAMEVSDVRGSEVGFGWP